MPGLSGRVRQLIPPQIRLKLYDLQPLRARRWRATPGIQTVGLPGVAVLTFDDGPDEQGTPITLAALNAEGLRATFFLVGEQLESHPEVGREIVRLGHDIGLHCQSHRRQDLLGAAAATEDFERGLATLQDILQIHPRWYRPPFGRCADITGGLCQRHGMEIVYWSTWGLDWEVIPHRRITARVARDLTDGAIVLLHDAATFSRRPTAQPTADAIAGIAHAARSSDVRLTTLADAVPRG